ncbi:NAD(P)H-hydrate dehydratase [Pelagicoccus albus]|uniref:ADP-dependent (S)-NAD(P)H-hydrate dehydratase n=1 Tax=Pelagicoccus albus TaxID=415222 RepID=A0A7X1B693_9BACT|nr:NAD(P)H-hydrate dehydratase [Pelagicoccus albus]MBC2606372.1 NAD(P)H-hydrate dehydratase [Pelagicoccus albus]
MNPDFSHPILSCADSGLWEEGLIHSEEQAWQAMRKVGTQLGQAIRSYFSMSRYPQEGLSVLGLIGKGHNGGDALLGILALLEDHSCIASISLILANSRDELKPNTNRALSILEDAADIRILETPSVESLDELRTESFDLCIDGLLGFQVRPPLREGVRTIVDYVNAHPSIRLRISIDLPSGVGDECDEEPFRADLTLATGIFKKPLLEAESAGALRYLDIGFFEKSNDASPRILVDAILDPLRALRPARSEKRAMGHLLVLAGSRSMPGALAMCVSSALRSGVGLVTVFAPESVCSTLAVSLPEAMWRPWPETPEGGLALEGLWQVKTMLSKASCLLMGPGMSDDSETQVLLKEIGKVWDKPAVLDADALRPEVVESFLQAGNRDLVLTPHDGEFKRLSGRADCSDAALLDYVKEKVVTVVKKGSATRVAQNDLLAVNAGGNPVLSRGGSGDLLAGLLAGLVAQGDASLFESACRAVYWHGKAADLLAIDKGQVAVRTTDLLDFLAPALQLGEVWNPNSPVKKPTGL